MHDVTIGGNPAEGTGERLVTLTGTTHEPLPDPQILLDWMASRGPEPVTARSIGDSGPRQFRRKAASDAALSELVAAGAVVQISTWPRAYRVKTQTDCHSGVLEQMTETTPTAVPLDEIRSRFFESLALHTDRGLSEHAAGYMAGRTVHEALRLDGRLAWPRLAANTCCYCRQRDNGTLVRLTTSDRIVHGRCFGRLRSAIATSIDELIAAAIG